MKDRLCVNERAMRECEWPGWVFRKVMGRKAAGHPHHPLSHPPLSHPPLSHTLIAELAYLGAARHGRAPRRSPRQRARARGEAPSGEAGCLPAESKTTWASTSG